MKKINIFLADDNAILRDGLKRILSEDKSYVIIGEAGGAREAVEKIETLKPDLVILDILMPDMSGFEAAKVIRSNNSTIKIIILTCHDNEEYVNRAIKNGVNGYILKNSSEDDLLKAVMDVMDGNIYLSPKYITSIVNGGFISTRNEHDKLNEDNEMLTVREREILKLVAEGNSNNKIASLLGISSETVKVHRKNIMNKLNVHNVAGLVKYSIKSGLVDS